ncbi:FAD binding domain-containing protein [Haloferax volcanii]|uniref:Xanthine dehydrogenase family protein subunit M n=1 Tax=Haloferax volcanii TaxID=2246 RepID=A0A558GEX9_HALVO|nr:FAD binding domain-containing protein [Haloferax volcanii]TVT96321.1 xanthine dehydrogenase family protein subunit M [Haloferax volcanii]
MTAFESVEYVEPETVPEAVERLADADETRVIASGYSLVPLLKDGIETPDRLIDVSGLNELRGITERGDGVAIGALVTHDEIATDATVAERARALADATDSVGDFQARNRGTIAGNLVFADPKYDAPAAFLALGGRVVTRGPAGGRAIAADDWFRGPGTTALDGNELVTRVEVPSVERSGYARTSEYSGYAVVGVAAAFETDDGVVRSARVAVNGAKPYPVRLPNVERALVDEAVGRVVDGDGATEAATAALDDVETASLLANDAATEEYRRQLVRTYCRQAIERAASEP